MITSGKTYRSLRYKIISMLLFSAVLVMLINACYQYLAQRQLLTVEREKENISIAERLAFTMQQPLWNFDWTAVEALIDQEMKGSQVQAVLLETPDDAMSIGKKRESLSSAVTTFTGKGLSIESSSLETRRAVTRDGITIGTICVITSDWQIRRKLSALMTQQAVQALAILCGIIALAYLGLSRLLLQPLKKLNTTAELYGRGDLSVRSDSNTEDEIGQLAETLNSMAEQLSNKIVEQARIEDQLREQNEELTSIEEELHHQLDETLAAQQERDQLQEQVLQQQKLEGIGLLAGGIAHDFNNLLTPIFGYAEMIRNNFDPADKSYERLGTILHAAGKAKDLVKQLLSFSRKQLLTSQLHNLNSITEEFASMLRRTIRENITLNLQLCDTNCPIMADKTQIEQILLNLAVNAQDAISGNGRITIETGHLILDNEYCNIHIGVRPGRYVMLSFSDSGCGMDDATLNHVFEPFFTTKAVDHGTGLGLSTVYGIVKQHDGHITIKSKPGNGTTFQIFIPESILEVSAGSRTVGCESMSPELIGTILLVEDNAMVREMTEDLLKSHDYTVISAEHPQAALQLFEQHRSDITLLLSDVVMPQMTGPELYEQLRAQMPELKVIFMSGYANDIKVHGGSLEEGVNFISKPFTSETLLRKICEITNSTV